ncbi:MAG TPA: Yip1 family protein [Sunxiuqinia sp.]|nr:Yip1 family protein [Sunxiuqinia sp.]
MDFKERYQSLFQTSARLLVEPGQFWRETQKEKSTTEVFRDFFLPLAILAGVAIFLGELITSAEFLFSYAIFRSLREIFSFILQYFLSVYVLNELLTSFGGVKNRLAISRLVAYSLLPMLVVSFITGLFPALYILEVLSLYGIFLFYKGVKGSLEIPEANKKWYAAIAFLLVFLIFMILNVTSWKLLQAFYGYGA